MVNVNEMGTTLAVHVRKIHIADSTSVAVDRNACFSCCSVTLIGVDHDLSYSSLDECLCARDLFGKYRRINWLHPTNPLQRVCQFIPHCENPVCRLSLMKCRKD